MATFLGAVNRILRIEGILRGDDDTISSFSSSQHAASIEFSKIAVQDELAWLTEHATIPYEETTGTVTVSTDTRTYSMPTNFQRFTAEPQLWELDSSSNVISTFTHVKPEKDVRRMDPSYESTSGSPSWFYFIGATTTKIGMYPVPTSSENGTVYKFWYDKTVDVTTASDTIPLITTAQFNAFCNVAARRFKFLRLNPVERDQLYPQGIEKDVNLETKRASLLLLLKTEKKPNRYGRHYS